jgi:hypothetical protein
VGCLPERAYQLGKALGEDFYTAMSDSIFDTDHKNHLLK